MSYLSETTQSALIGNFTYRETVSRDLANYYLKMKTTLIIILISIAGFFLKSCFSHNEFRNKSRPTSGKPMQKISNDKIVYISGVNLADLKQVIEQFCNSYNQETFTALPLLTIMNEQEFVVTFPFDTDFATFCFFVNYLHYPNNIKYKPNISAWASTKAGDDWMTNEIINKKVMLYIPIDDKDYDNVYLTTEDNIGYKMGFGVGEESQRLNNPRKTFEKLIDLNQLNGKQQIQFE